MRCDLNALNPVFRVLDALVSVYIVAAGVQGVGFRFFFSIIYGLMLIAIGILLFIAALWEFAPVVEYAKGLRTHFGLGFTWIFFACITISGQDWRIGCSVFTFVLGLVYVVLSFAVSGAAPQAILGPWACSCNCKRPAKSSGVAPASAA
jgi:hypothetical protein